MIRVRGAAWTMVYFFGLNALAADAPNLLDNSSFESESQPNGVPLGWSLWTNNETGYRCESAPGGRTGKNCLKVEGAGTRGVVFAKGVPIDRSKRYALRGWVKLEGEQDAQALIMFHYFDKGKWLGLPDKIGVSSRHKGWLLLEKTDRVDYVPAASMIWFSCTLEGKGTAWFDDIELKAYDRDKLPSDFNSRFGASNKAPEFKVLARLIGDWDTHTTISPGIWVANGSVSDGVETVEWTLGDKVLQSKHVQRPENAETLELETYDAQQGVFRLWHFDSAGNFPRGNYEGRWDEKTSTLTYEGTDADGVSVRLARRFLSDDRLETEAVWRDKSGQVVMEMKKSADRRR
jgi:hypothetical protein